MGDAPGVAAKTGRARASLARQHVSCVSFHRRQLLSPHCGHGGVCTFAEIRPCTTMTLKRCISRGFKMPRWRWEKVFRVLPKHSKKYQNQGRTKKRSDLGPTLNIIIWNEWRTNVIAKIQIKVEPSRKLKNAAPLLIVNETWHSRCYYKVREFLAPTRGTKSGTIRW